MASRASGEKPQSRLIAKGIFKMTFRSNNEKAPIAPTIEAAKQNVQINYNSASAQRQRILDALKNSPLSTIEARRDLDVMHPGARIMELRKRGHQIITVWNLEPTECGREHRVGKYFLLKMAVKP